MFTAYNTGEQSTVESRSVCHARQPVKRHQATLQVTSRGSLTIIMCIPLSPPRPVNPKPRPAGSPQKAKTTQAAGPPPHPSRHSAALSSRGRRGSATAGRDRIGPRPGAGPQPGPGRAGYLISMFLSRPWYCLSWIHLVATHFSPLRIIYIYIHTYIHMYKIEIILLVAHFCEKSPPPPPSPSNTSRPCES
jgi:hypothetical protein